MTPYYDKNGITIYCGDNVEVMRAIEPQVELTVTSPPYDNLRSYNGYSWSFEDLSKELFKATKSGGVVVWVVGDATIDGSETGTSFRQALGFMECGFKLHDTMIYKRKTKPLTHNRYEQEFEYMFIFAKDGDKVVCNHLVEDSIHSGDIHYRDTTAHRDTDGVIRRKSEKIICKPTKIKGNIWEYATGKHNSTKDKIAFNHLAIFPEALARDHIISWSNEGDTVLDPFLGSGTTLKACQLLGRRGIGIELSKEYCKIAVDRLRQMSFFSLPS